MKKKIFARAPYQRNPLFFLHSIVSFTDDGFLRFEWNLHRLRSVFHLYGNVPFTISHYPVLLPFVILSIRKHHSQNDGGQSKIRIYSLSFKVIQFTCAVNMCHLLHHTDYDHRLLNLTLIPLSKIIIIIITKRRVTEMRARAVVIGDTFQSSLNRRQKNVCRSNGFFMQMHCIIEIQSLSR